MSRRGIIGRPNKGDRDAIMTRPSRALGDVVREAADKQGLSISDYVANLLAREHGFPVADQDQDQGVLPLGRTA